MKSLDNIIHVIVLFVIQFQKITRKHFIYLSTYRLFILTIDCLQVS